MVSVEVQILQDVSSAAVLAIGSALTYVTSKVLPKYIHSKTAQNAIDGLASIAHSVVAEFNAKVVSQAKANGVFTPQLAAAVKQDAVQAVMSQGSALVTLAQKSVGDVSQLVSSLIEQAVAVNHIPNTQPAPEPAKQA